VKGNDKNEKRKSFFKEGAAVQDVTTGNMQGVGRMKIKDITALTQNYIVAKALSGFSDAGVIPRVRYVEEEDLPAAQENN